MNVLKVNQYKILEDAYKKHGNIIVCFDFDNTVYDFHQKGIDFTPVRELLKECDELGFQLICHTSNGGPRLTFIRFYLNEVVGIHGIEHNLLINRTTKYDSSEATEFHTKPYANIYLDDKGGLVETYKRLRKLVTKIKNKEI